MSTKRRRKGQGICRSSPRSEIPHFFPSSRPSTPRTRSAATRGAAYTGSPMTASPASPPADADFPTGFPVSLLSQPPPTPGPATTPPASMEVQDLKALLQALPTRADMEALVLRLEEAHRREIRGVKADVQALSDRVIAGESSLTSLESRVALLEWAQTLQSTQVSMLQLRMEELEDRNRRNNLRLRGIPEASGQESLPHTVLAIFQQVVAAAEPQDMEFDRVHRALGPRSPDPNRPRDVICRLHHYSHKDLIVRKAWEAGDVDFDGASVKILPDLSRATLQRRALLRPLLDKLRRLGCTYRWGFPISLTIRRGSSSYTLADPSDLPGLFSFLETDSFSVPNWLQPLLRPSRRQNSPPDLPNLSPRRGRGRQRARNLSAPDTREV